MNDQSKPQRAAKENNPNPNRSAIANGGVLSRSGLAHNARLIQRNRHEPGLVNHELVPRSVQHLGIVGCGLMGRSICKIAVAQSIRVTMVDVAQTALQQAQEMFANDPQVTISDQYSSLRNADLIIEAVVETISVKKTVHQRIEAVVTPEALIASNTSSIPLASMETHFATPERFCGIHFCHPEVMSIVEVVSGPTTTEQTTADAVGFVRQLEKMPVAINDCPGFVVNRLLSAMLNQSLRLLGQGREVSEIDAAMRGFGFQAGPFEIIDIIGADTCMYAGRTMWEHKLKCVSLSPILPRMVKLGRLGRKAGVGFYCYPDSNGAAIPDPDLAPLIAPYQNPPPAGGQDLNASSTDQIERENLALEILAPTVW